MSAPNVVVLIFDALRPDYLGCYGGDSATPTFDTAAEEGVLFESAFAGGPATPVSHATLYTGLYPSEHGVTGQYIPLRDDVPVIAEWLRDAGYDTFGITGPAKMGSDWGYDRGFDELYEPYYEFPPKTSLENLTKSIRDPRFRRYFLRKVTRGGADKTRFKFDLLRDRISNRLDRPFFALANLLTVHAPYDPPRPYKEQATPGFSRPRWFFLEFLLDRHGAFEDERLRPERITNAQTVDGMGRYLADPDYLNDAEVEVLRDWYRASVEYLDDEFSSFLEFYREELQDDTILILTADHGEHLGEHGLWEHSHYLYDETMSVPLIVAGPGVPEGVRKDQLASLVDIFETVCDLCDVPPPEGTSGRSLFGDTPRDAVFMEYGERDADDFRNNSGHGRYLDDDQLARFSAGRKAIRTQDYQLEITTDSTGRLLELPEQVEVEITSETVGTVESLRERLLETLGDDFGTWPEGDPEQVGLNHQVESNLRQLGYID